MIGAGWAEIYHLARSARKLRCDCAWQEQHDRHWPRRSLQYPIAQLCGRCALEAVRIEHAQPWNRSVSSYAPLRRRSDTTVSGSNHEQVVVLELCRSKSVAPVWPCARIWSPFKQLAGKQTGAHQKNREHREEKRFKSLAFFADQRGAIPQDPSHHVSNKHPDRERRRLCRCSAGASLATILLQYLSRRRRTSGGRARAVSVSLSSPARPALSWRCGSS